DGPVVPLLLAPERRRQVAAVQRVTRPADGGAVELAIAPAKVDGCGELGLIEQACGRGHGGRIRDARGLGDWCWWLVIGVGGLGRVGWGERSCAGKERDGRAAGEDRLRMTRDDRVVLRVREDVEAALADGVEDLIGDLRGGEAGGERLAHHLPADR